MEPAPPGPRSAGAAKSSIAEVANKEGPFNYQVITKSL